VNLTYMSSRNIWTVAFLLVLTCCTCVSVVVADTNTDGISFQEGLPAELVIDTNLPLDDQLGQLDAMVRWGEDNEPKPKGGLLSGIKKTFAGPEGPTPTTVSVLRDNLGEIQGAQVTITGIYTASEDGSRGILTTAEGTVPVTLGGGVQPEGFGESPLGGVPAVVAGLVEVVNTSPEPSIRVTRLTPAGWLATLRIARIHEIQGDFKSAQAAYMQAADAAHTAGVLFSGFAAVRAAELAMEQLADPAQAEKLYNKAWTQCGTLDSQGHCAYLTWQLKDGVWAETPLRNVVGPVLDSLNRERFWYRVVAGFVALGGSNPGIGVILLAFAVRLMIWPLTRKQLESAQSMQALQPQMKALQEKYVDDKQKFQEEFWKLCQSRGVNPLGGCLPMLIQFPILIMLYRGIRAYIWHFDNASFLWIHNLAAPDMILLVAYTISMIMFQKATQRMQPAAAMNPQQAQQQQMMTWMMPIMFFFFFQSFPAAFLLYWLSSNVFYFGEQYIHRTIRKSAATCDDVAADTPKPAGGLVSGMVKLLSPEDNSEQKEAETQRTSYADRKAAESGKKGRKVDARKKRR
jgi:YidC/Oxa1 family membrane protein insertase